MDNEQKESLTLQDSSCSMGTITDPVTLETLVGVNLMGRVLVVNSGSARKLAALFIEGADLADAMNSGSPGTVN